MDHFLVALAVVMALALLLSGLAHFARAKHADALADDLEIAEEALDAGAHALAKVSAGTPIEKALEELPQDPEAVDALKRVLSKFKKVAPVFLLFLFLAGCASPAHAYVQAEADAWAQFDPYLDGWVDHEPAFSDAKKDALHQLNLARRARVAHALAEFAPVGSASK